MELRQTVNKMLSNDYKDRFVAEYEQLNIRYNKLSVMVLKYREGKLDFKPTCPIELLEKQLESMRIYLECLYERAELEGIELPE